MTAEPLVVRVERVLDAPPERIFAAWTDPAVLRRWFAAEPDWTTPEAETDVRVGGSYRLAMRSGDGAVHTMTGEYLEVDPPHRLVYTWRRQPRAGGPAHSVVSVDFIAEGSATRVVLEERGFPDVAERDSHDRGWRGCIDNLERRVVAAA
jgi:uncharacterized protein YndB with AHSA1/START domain